jgi:hypothetical protein
MDEHIVNEINRLKEEIHKQKEAVATVAGLVKGEIDRPFHTDLWELSERELDHEMGSRLSFMNDDIDTKPDSGSIVSHRRLLGKPVVLFKRLMMKMFRPYTNLLLEKQRHFNEQAVAFHLASFIRFRHNETRIKAIEEKLKEIEEEQELLKDRLTTLADKK